VERQKVKSLIIITDYEEYLVKEGDSIESIGKKRNVSKEVIIKVNKLLGEVSQGEIIMVPKVDTKVSEIASIATGN